MSQSDSADAAVERPAPQGNKMNADMSAYVHKFRANGDNSQQSGSNKVNKRNRQPLSCLPCRQRKLRCDRHHPCETCVKHNDESSCTYTKASTSSSNKDAPATRTKAQDRLRNLEQLVMQMVDNGSPAKTQSSTASSGVSIARTSSHEQSSNSSTRDGSLDGSAAGKYVGSTHWSAILENIQELKSAIGDQTARSPDLNDLDELETPDQEILFGCKRTVPLQQTLAEFLPPRLTVDRLLATYFNAKYMVLPYIHTYQFQRQYERFWRDHSSMPPLWVSILFSICCLSTQLNQAIGGDTTNQDLQASPATLYLTASAQCLILGGYTRPKPHIVEALALYSQCKYMSTMDPSKDVGIIFAILIRLAYRMAFHRDADNYPHLSVFEGEMRRRVWTMCRQFDLMLSFQLGLPNNIPLDSWDTKPPRNLLDSDFDENTTVLPPSRPEHEPTQILYFIVKARLMSNFGRICNHALSFKNSSQAEVMDLDAQVRATFSQVPYTLRIRPMSQSFADPPYLLMVRLNCEFLYQKSLLVLHRKYMAQGFEYSTSRCIDAAKAIIECFADMHKEFRPGGALYNDRWMLGSFTMNDFLLASMVLCLSLSQWLKKNPGKSVKEDAFMTKQLEMLRTCHAICQERSATSIESRRVADVLGAMLAQVEPTSPPFSQPQPMANTTADKSKSSYRQTATSEASNDNVMNLTPLTLTEAPLPQNGVGPIANSDMGLFENFLEGTDNIDWTFFDQYLSIPNLHNSDATTGAGADGQAMQLDNSQDWVSTPYRFLGRDQRAPATYDSGLGTGGVTMIPSNNQGNAAWGSALTRGGPENGHTALY